MFDYLVPVHMPLLGKNEDHRMIVEGEIRRAVRRLWPNVCLVSLIQGRYRVVSRLSVIIGGFVIKKGDLKVILFRGLLQESKVVIREWSALAIPVNNEGGDAHVSCLLNLPSQDIRVIAGVTNVPMSVVAKPGHVDCEESGAGIWSLCVLLQRAMNARRGTTGSHHETHNGQRQQPVRQENTPCIH